MKEALEKSSDTSCCRQSDTFVARDHSAAIIIGFVLAIPLAMMLEASLSFFGSAYPADPTWGQMINGGIDFVYFYWHLAIFPTAALAITMLATSLLGDGLCDALDPTLKGR